MKIPLSVPFEGGGQLRCASTRLLNRSSQFIIRAQRLGPTLFILCDPPLIGGVVHLLGFASANEKFSPNRTLVR